MSERSEFDALVRPLRDERHREFVAANVSHYVLGKPGSRFAVTAGGAISRMKRNPRGGLRLFRRWIVWWSA